MRTTTREDVFRLHAEICGALAEPRRVLILMELRHGPRAVGEIAKAVAASQPMTSRHLAILREKQLVVATREGSFVRYSLADERVLTAIDILLDVLASQLARQGARGDAVRRLRSATRVA
jgi:DNA-binding transcriptional ArsR family regulator